ncbi:MAG: SDR family NAD(P)-dependent oxidoreductase, partial [Rubrobacteraceae bacterium]
MSAESRVALVTGAGRGIGRRVALELAARGYAVAANDLREPEEVLGELRDAGANVLSVPGDVSDETAVRERLGTIVERFGRIDVLVNNAGVSFITPAEETSLADWNR